MWLYVHEDVPGITMDRATPLLLNTGLVKAERASRVARYAFPCRLLAKWTDGALRSVGGGLRGARMDAYASCGEVGEGVPPAASACEWTRRGGGGQ